MSRRMLLVLLLAAFLFAAVPSGTFADRPHRPNILFLFADDQRSDAVGAFGNSVLKTPNIDALVHHGYRFRNAYCMGSMGGAVCVPSRAMLNSGRTLFHVKTNLAGATLLPEVLRKNGYITFGTGKWHNGQASFRRGFQQGRAVFFGGMSDHTQVPLVDLTNGQFVNKRVGKKFSSTLFADAAIDFLQNHRGNKPFYAYVAFTAPHDPRQAPQQYLSMYDPRKMPLPKNFLPQHPFNNGWLVLRDEVLAPWPRTPEVIRNQIAEYYALISHLDAQIGRILQALRGKEQAKNTIIVYAADHGLALGSHGLLGKQSLYEHSMKTPLVFVGPGIPQGQSTGALAYLFDVFPTLCELTGIAPPADVEGKSLAPIWRGEKTGVRESVFTAFSRHMRAVRDQRFKLIRYPQINKTQLFDLKNDPEEMHNLADDSKYAPQVKRLMSLLQTWQKNAGDAQPLSSEKPQRAHIDLTGRARIPDRHQPKWIVEKYFRSRGPEQRKPER